MITPIFKVDQDHDYLYVSIRVTNIRTLSSEDIEVFYEGKEFIFYGRPYYLRLEFPSEVQSSDSIIKNDYEDDIQPQDQLRRIPVTYESETNELKIPVPKKQPGEHFENLDMIGQLLAKPKTKPSRRLIEVLRSDPIIPIISSPNESQDEDEEEFDWTFEQRLPDLDTNFLLGRQPYGFANNLLGIIENSDPEAIELFDIKNPEQKTLSQRRMERLRKEFNDFDEEHYLADLYDDKLIKPLIDASVPWDNWSERDVLTDNDRQRIIDQLPRKEYVKYDSPIKKAMLLSIFDILYAYAYDLRTNDWEHTVESCWNIRKLSPTLSCFEFWLPCDLELLDADENLPRPKDENNLAMYMLACSIRRSLIYPLYRNWTLSIKVANDVINIISKGRNAILKCLLDIHQIMANNEDSQLINDLYMTDYCCWIQQQKPDSFESLAKYLKNHQHKIDSKDNVGLDLIILERASQLAIQEQETGDRLINKLKHLILNNSQDNHGLDSDDSDDDNLEKE